MKTSVKSITLGALLALFSFGCAATDSQSESVTKTTSATQNLATAWCEKKGGKVMNVKTNAKSATSTGRVAKCLLPSGELIDQWKLYKRDHK